MAAARPLVHSYVASTAVIVVQTVVFGGSFNTGIHALKQHIIVNLDHFKPPHVPRPAGSSILIGCVCNFYKSHVCRFVHLSWTQICTQDWSMRPLGMTSTPYCEAGELRASPSAFLAVLWSISIRNRFHTHCSCWQRMLHYMSYTLAVLWKFASYYKRQQSGLTAECQHSEPSQRTIHGEAQLDAASLQCLPK